MRHAASSFTTRAAGSLVWVGVLVLVLVLVLVGVIVGVGGGAVSVGVGWVGVDDGLGEGSTVALGIKTFSTLAVFVGELELHPAISDNNSRKIKMCFARSSMVDFKSWSPRVGGSGNYNR
jgi:uncharacterized membrane protein